MECFGLPPSRSCHHVCGGDITVSNFATQFDYSLRQKGLVTVTRRAVQPSGRNCNNLLRFGAACTQPPPSTARPPLAVFQRCPLREYVCLLHVGRD